MYHYGMSGKEMAVTILSSLSFCYDYLFDKQVCLYYSLTKVSLVELIKTSWRDLYALVLVYYYYYYYTLKMAKF